MLGEAKDELDKIKKCQTQTNALRERFEDDFDLIRSEKYTIPKKEGDWESFTTNRPSTDANKVVNTLASSRVQIKIRLSDEEEKKRKHLSKTERFPYGAIALRDSIYGTIPEALPLHASLSWYAPNRGWIAILCYLYEKEGKVIPHIPVWDMLNTYWISGSDGLLWACYKRYASPEDVKNQYEKDLKPDKQGRITLYDIWDRDQFGVIAEQDWLKKPTDHNVKHLPILILPAGSTPLIQSGRHDDTIKNVGESCLVNNRHLYNTESRMGSYALTLSGRAAKAPLELRYDSTKAGKPIEFEGNPFAKGATVNVDIGKGQSINPMTPPEMTRDFFAFWEYLQGRLSVGGMTPISFGQINQALPAAGINILRHASMDNIKPPQQLIERTYEWLAHELVSQYKSGDFGKMELQGLDGLNRRFKMEVKPDDIDDSWNFEAKLLVDMPQDELANIGMAVQAVEAELLSRQTARDKYNLVDDTDLEQRTLDREKVYRVAGIQMRKMATALREDGDEEGAQYILDELEKMQEIKEKGVASQAGIPTPVRPSGATTAATPTPPESIAKRPNAFQRFLSRLGGAQQ